MSHEWMMADELCHFSRPQGQTQQGQRDEKYFFFKDLCQEPIWLTAY